MGTQAAIRPYTKKRMVTIRRVLEKHVSALAAIQLDLDMNAIQLSWIATAYLLALASTGKTAASTGAKNGFGRGWYFFHVQVRTQKRQAE